MTGLRERHNITHKTKVVKMYPLELHCNEMTSDYAVPRTEKIPSYDGIQSKPDELNVNASEFQPKKTAATIGSIKMSDMVANETDDE